MDSHEAGNNKCQHGCKWGQKAKHQKGTCDELSYWNAHSKDIRHRVASVLRLQTGDASGLPDAKERAHAFNDEEAAQRDTDEEQTKVNGAALAVLTTQCLFFLSLGCCGGIGIESQGRVIRILPWCIKVLASRLVFCVRPSTRPAST